MSLFERALRFLKPPAVVEQAAKDVSPAPEFLARTSLAQGRLDSLVAPAREHLESAGSRLDRHASAMTRAEKAVAGARETADRTGKPPNHMNDTFGLMGDNRLPQSVYSELEEHGRTVERVMDGRRIERDLEQAHELLFKADGVTLKDGDLPLDTRGVSEAWDEHRRLTDAFSALKRRASNTYGDIWGDVGRPVPRGR